MKISAENSDGGMFNVSVRRLLSNFWIENASRDGTVTELEFTQIGPMRDLRFVGAEDAAPGECCYFTLIGGYVGWYRIANGALRQLRARDAKRGELAGVLANGLNLY